MGFYYSEDPASDFDRWDADQNRRLAQRPVCSECEEHIQDEEAYYINGEWICGDCMESRRKAAPPGQHLVCSDCGARIWKYYEINDEPICLACIEAYKRPVDDFI